VPCYSIPISTSVPIYNARVNRRRFLSSAAAGAVVYTSNLPSAAAQNIPIIDSHIHLFDISRPQGVPWPEKGSPIYQTALPPRLRKLAEPHGVVGAIEIECSPWLADNDWVLDVAAKDPFIVGTIGDIEPAKPDFGKNLERLHKNPLFRGIRCGNIWNRDLSKDIDSPAFVDDLKLLASAGLVLDTANQTPALIHAVVRLSDSIPNLKIVIDHLPGLKVPEEAAARKACEDNLKVLGHRPQVFAKISAIVRKVDGRVPLDISFYKDRLDHIWDIFGADRLLFGSDWPNSDQLAQYSDVFHLAEEFIAPRDRATKEKFYWKNSLKAYSWVKRDASQPA
jgi:L-fuconolactonase